MKDIIELLNDPDEYFDAIDHAIREIKLLRAACASAWAYVNDHPKAEDKNGTNDRIEKALISAGYSIPEQESDYLVICKDCGAEGPCSANPFKAEKW